MKVTHRNSGHWRDSTNWIRVPDKNLIHPAHRRAFIWALVLSVGITVGIYGLVFFFLWLIG